MSNVFFEAVEARQEAINSLLCVGLDPEPAKIPQRYQSEDRPILRFCLDVINATKDVASCYKPQFAHFAAADALSDLEEVMLALKSEGLTRHLRCQAGRRGQHQSLLR